MDIRQEKAHIREAIKERLKRVTDAERLAESRTLCRELLHILPDEPIVVCGYFPLTDEADLRPALLELLKRGCTVYLPRFNGKTLEFRQTMNLHELPTGVLKIPEPSDDAPLVDEETIDFVFVPGRAFTRDGRRLGRGNGGYDIWIKKQREKNPETQYIGIALECQLVAEIPLEAHDENVDFLMTARGRM